MSINIDTLVRDLMKTGGEGMGRPTMQGNFDLAMAYRTLHQLHKAQLAEGQVLAGRKIGISNPAAWDKLGLSDIVWGYMFEDTVHFAKGAEYQLSLEGLSQPRLEPEIVFGLKNTLPTNTRDPVELLASVAWMALGFEVVQCPYPDWQFQPADLVATFGFHGALVVGERVFLEGQSLSRLAASLSETGTTLFKGDEVVAEGGGDNVVDSPAGVLGHLADLVVGDDGAVPLGADELITTGTLTSAPDVAVGETYRAETSGLELPALTLHFE